MKVWNVDTERVEDVPEDEARAGLVRYARSLGPGTPACGELERQALAPLTECPDCHRPKGRPCAPWCLNEAHPED